MASGEPYDGNILLVDSSVWIKLPRAPQSAQSQFFEAHRREQLRGSPVVQLELLYGSADLRRVQEEQALLDQLPTLPLSRAIGEAAVSAMVRLAESGSPGSHKVKWPDLLIAATAAERGFGVLHHDRDFDRIRGVLEFDSVWFADADERNW